MYCWTERSFLRAAKVAVSHLSIFGAFKLLAEKCVRLVFVNSNISFSLLMILIILFLIPTVLVVQVQVVPFSRVCPFSI